MRNKKNNFEIYDKINRDLSVVLNKFIKNNKNNLILQHEKIDLTKEYKNHLYTKIIQENVFNNFYFDLTNDNLKKKYFVTSLEKKNILKEIFKLNKINNIKIKVLKNFYKKKYIIKLLYWILSNLNLKKVNIPKDKKKYFCLSNHKKYKSFFKELFDEKLLYISGLNYLSFFLKVIVNGEFYQKKKVKKDKINYYYFQKHFIKRKIYEYELSKYNFKKIIYFEGDSPDHSLISELGKRRGLKSFCIQWGGILFNKPKLPFQNLSCDYFFCWGKNYEKIMKKYNKNTIFYDVGNPFLVEKKSLTKKRIIILVPQKGILFNGEFKKKYFLLLKWLIKEYKNLIQIKLHPIELTNSELTKENKISQRNFVPSKKNLYEVLNVYSIIIGSCSSALLEASRVGLMPILYIPDKNSKHLWSKTINRLKRINNFNLLTDNLDHIKKTVSIMMKRNNDDEILKIKKIFSSEISLVGKKSKKKLNNKINSIL